MKRARFTEERIIGVLREHEAGAKTADLARKHGVSEATIYNWKAKFGGMDVSEAKRLRALERAMDGVRFDYQKGQEIVDTVDVIRLRADEILCGGEPHDQD